MSAPTFNTRHTLTGQVQRLTEGQIRPFKDHLEIVADDAKPVAAELLQPATVTEREESKSTGKKSSRATSGKAVAEPSTSDDGSDSVDPETVDPEGDSQ